ncbi:hypothetical protein [Microbacterium sp. Root180]|uniref:hypothetical protein n=1 Tax=Microbacterium sp. Root180 TaxID=1736483 RepID=UPI0007020600|nr:hypothetical protein [Microbacterium sp. Root180]KRB36723.1 hypothetical protein ASD93_11830 [Microbacterium sp. Root180]
MTTIHTNRQHRVHVIEGDAQGIIDRGREISRLGRQMIGAAGVLRAIADGAGEERGRSIERIRDEVGDAHEELALAGERYKPTGTAMTTYGHALDGVQSKLRPLVLEIEQAKRQLEAKMSAAQDAQETAEDSSDYDPTDSTAQGTHETDRWQAREAGIAAGNAKIHFDGLLDDFDDQWNAWDEAYDTALNAIEDATEGNVSDSWTDNIADIVQVIVDVVTVIGLVVTIAALVIGGPILALIAVALAVVVLLGTLLLYDAGRASGGDLAWAIVGVLPFGRLGSLFKAGSRMQALKFLAGPVFDIGDAIGDIRRLRGVRVAVETMGTGHGLGNVARAGLASRIADTFSGLRWGDIGRSTLWANINRGGGAWTVNIADEFAGLSAHHQSVVNAVSDASDIVARGNEVIDLPQRLANLGDFGAKGLSFGRDTVELVSGAFEQPFELPADIDTWREQLAR